MTTVWERLRAPFPPELVGKLPRVTCRACGARDNRTGTCDRHPEKARCDGCGNWMTPAHIHLDYVGHADITDRLLQADPCWSWEPVTRNVDPQILAQAISTGNPDIIRLVYEAAPPRLDEHGGLWIRLTVHDDDGEPMTRLGYGDSQGKTGPNAIKEVIGDALRNAAMRFGAGLDLWAKGDRAEMRHVEEAAPTGPRRAPKTPEHQSSGKQTGEQATNGTAQALAVTAMRARSVDGLRSRVYDPARAQGLLNAPVAHPTTGEVMPLHRLIAERKTNLIGEHTTDQAGEDPLPAAQTLVTDAIRDAKLHRPWVEETAQRQTGKAFADFTADELVELARRITTGQFLEDVEREAS